MQELFARCARGFEDVLASELKGLHLRQVRPLKGGVAFFGATVDAYRACLHSRIATRIQLVLARVEAGTAQNLYDGAAAFAWEEHLAPGATIAVQAHGQNAALRNTQFTALKVKDAVCDRMREKRGTRPDVDAKNPDFAIDVSLHRSKATLYLNLSGPSLHRRGYRQEGVQTTAPLKETLAAGMLLASGWDELARQGSAFADPMCGSGTLAIEAALIATHRAPGLLRERWGFSGWLKHDQDAWCSLVDEARGQAKGEYAAPIVACDCDSQAVRIACDNAERAGVGDVVRFACCDASKLPEQLGHAARKRGGQLPSQGLVAVNPPYGERMSTADELPDTYASLARAVADLPAGWRLAAITPDATIDTALGRVPERVLECNNGPLEAQVRIYRADPAQHQSVQVVSLAGVQHSVGVAEKNSEQFAARLRKVARERAKWARKAGVSCYRVYDADLPDYAFAIDVYEADGSCERQRFVRMAEYQAPDTVDQDRAARRFSDACALVPAVLDIDRSQLFSKVRRREKGGGQYRDARERPRVVRVREAAYTFEVDLAGHLDTGLFLDHRETRRMIQDMAADARFLNLFAYTGTATVYAAGGGAAQTTTVDMSRTYLDWAQRNMRANGFAGPEHVFERCDVLEWVERSKRSGVAFDLIFCDPPTFSNSKSMGKRTWSVHRDHADLIQNLSSLLAQDGTLVFSTNLRTFKLDEQALDACGLVARNVTAETIPHDFERTPKVHRCYLVRRA